MHTTLVVLDPPIYLDPIFRTTFCNKSDLIKIIRFWSKLKFVDLPLLGHNDMFTNQLSSPRNVIGTIWLYT